MLTSHNEKCWSIAVTLIAFGVLLAPLAIYFVFDLDTLVLQWDGSDIPTWFDKAQSDYEFLLLNYSKNDADRFSVFFISTFFIANIVAIIAAIVTILTWNKFKPTDKKSEVTTKGLVISFLIFAYAFYLSWINESNFLLPGESSVYGFHPGMKAFLVTYGLTAGYSLFLFFFLVVVIGAFQIRKRRY